MSKFPEFPPKGFQPLRHFPHVWKPIHREILTGYVCDPRPDCIGILVTSHGEGATSDHGPIEIGQVVHVAANRDALDTLLGLIEYGTPGSDPATYKVALQADRTALSPSEIGYSIGWEATAPIGMKQAYENAQALRPKPLTPPPEPAPPAPATPSPQAQPVANPADSATPAPSVPTP